jgi:glycosyltransferase involved in cell wall biosynthesis
LKSPSIAYIISNIDKALAFEWTAEELLRHRHPLFFILLNPGPSQLADWLKAKNIPVFCITYRGKKDLPKALLATARILRHEKATSVHCHLFDASVIGLLAAHLANVPQKIYTRHYATYHHVYFPRAVWYDRFVNWLATDIIAISENVKQVLIKKEGVPSHKIHLVPHGFRLQNFQQLPEERVARLRQKHGISGQFPVIGVISRYIELKGIQYIIPAFQQLLAHYPQAHLVLANASGDYTPQIKFLLRSLPAGSYTEIPFEADIEALYQLFTLFVHVPIESSLEAFGQTYVEALAAGIPSVFTLSGIAPEFILHRQNAFVVPYCNTGKIYDSFLELLTDSSLRQQIVKQGKEDVEARFGLQKMIQKLIDIYR